MDGYVTIGFIQSVLHDSPYLKVQLLTDFPDRFDQGNSVFIEFFDKNPKRFQIEESITNKHGILIKFLGFDTFDVCDILIGKYIYIPIEKVKSLPEGVYYFHDLIDSSVIIEDETVGIISDVLSLPANDVYVVKLTSGKELLIPALKEIIEDFDVAEKKLTMKVPKSYFNYED